MRGKRAADVAEVGSLGWGVDAFSGRIWSRLFVDEIESEVILTHKISVTLKFGWNCTYSSSLKLNSSKRSVSISLGIETFTSFVFSGKIDYVPFAGTPTSAIYPVYLRERLPPRKGKDGEGAGRRAEENAGEETLRSEVVEFAWIAAGRYVSMPACLPLA